VFADYNSEIFFCQKLLKIAENCDHNIDEK
jgi:hypothetical protein